MGPCTPSGSRANEDNGLNRPGTLSRGCVFACAVTRAPTRGGSFCHPVDVVKAKGQTNGQLLPNAPVSYRLGVQDQSRHVRVRQFDPADAAAVEAVMRRSFALGGPEGVTLEEHVGGIAALLEHPEEAAVAVAGAGIVGYTHPAGVRLEVDPDHRRRAYGRLLLEAARGIAAAAGEERLELWVPVAGPGRAFAEAVGMRYRSSFHLLRLAAGQPVPVPDTLDGIQTRYITPGDDNVAVVALLNQAFADHPSPMRFDVGRMAEAHRRPDFDPTDVLLAHVAGEPENLVGFCRATVGPAADMPLRGDIRLVGVLPAYRRRGIGRELLRWGVGHTRARGAEEVDLVVEALNAGAIRLYGDEGFGHVAEWPRWTLEPAAPG